MHCNSFKVKYSILFAKLVLCSVEKAFVQCFLIATGKGHEKNYF